MSTSNYTRIVRFPSSNTPPLGAGFFITRTGQTEQVPKGVGLGWDYAPGASRAELYRDQLAIKQQEFRDGK